MNCNKKDCFYFGSCNKKCSENDLSNNFSFYTPEESLFKKNDFQSLIKCTANEQDFENSEINKSKQE